MSSPAIPVNLYDDLPLQSRLYKAGSSARTFLKKYGARVLATVAALVLVALIVYFWLTFLETKQECDSSYDAFTKALQHTMCGYNGSCGSDCPYANQNDPRVLMRKRIHEAKRSLAEYEYLLQSDMAAQAAQAVGMAPESAAVLSTYLNVEVNAIEKSRWILGAAANIAAPFDAETGPIGVGAITAQSRVETLYVALECLRVRFAIAHAVRKAEVMDYNMKRLSSVQQKTVPGYDEAILKTAAHMVSLKAANDEMTADVAEGSLLMTSVMAAINTGTLDPNTATGLLTSLISIRAGHYTKWDLVDQLYKSVYTAYASMTSACESFSNGTKEKFNEKDVGTFIDRNDYASAAMAMALEPEVVTNHRKFAKERTALNSGGGLQSVRDDDNDMIPWVGLFGRPTYRRSDGTPVGSESTTPLQSVPSEDVGERTRKPLISLNVS